MRFVTPLVFHVAQTRIIEEGLDSYLQAIGAPSWNTNATCDAEKLIEVAGKTCYKSFSTDLNANLTRVREMDNEGYIGNSILDQAHGSVLEHACDTFVFVNVSRIFTHELVRHRIAGYSQESLRFVRLTDLGMYYPEVFKQPFLDTLQDALRQEGKELNTDETKLRNVFRRVTQFLEDIQLDLAADLGLDNLRNFNLKKKLTSAMRRLAPEGLATVIMTTTNHRTWRFVIQQRTSRAAEEEIRLVYGAVFERMRQQYPNIYQDAEVEMVEGLVEVKFRNHKI